MPHFKVVESYEFPLLTFGRKYYIEILSLTLVESLLSFFLPMCSSQASGNKLWDHFSFMAPPLMERNSTQTTFQHLPVVVQEFVKIYFWGSDGFHGGCDG